MWALTKTFFSASHLVCFRCENTVTNIELSPCLKIAPCLLLLFPLATKAIVYFGVWKRSVETIHVVQKGAQGGSMGRMLPSGVAVISAIANTRSFFSPEFHKNYQLGHPHANLDPLLSGHSSEHFH